MSTVTGRRSSSSTPASPTARQWEAVTRADPAAADGHPLRPPRLRALAKYKRGRYSASLDLLELLDGLALDRVVACGNSAGGAGAARGGGAPARALRAPGAARPACCALELSERARAYGEAEEAALAAGDLDRAIELNLDMWVHRAEHREPVATMLRRALENQRKRPFEEFGLEDPPLAERLDRITCPVRILVGEHDVEDFRAIAWHLADRLADATAEEVPDAGHLLGLEAAELVASTL